MNPTALPAFGNTPDLIGRNFDEVLHIFWQKAKADEIAKRFRHTLETGEPYLVPEQIEERIDRAGIEYYEWQINRIPLPDGGYGVVCYFRDISDRVQVQIKIRESEERYRNLFNSIDEGFCVLEMIFDEHQKPVDWRFLEVNPSFERHTGMLDIVGKRVRELLPDHEAYWFETYGKVALTGEPIRFVNAAKELEGRWFDLYAFRVGGPGSYKVAVLFTNISERKQAEQALRQSELRFRALFDRGPIAMYSCDSAGVIQEFNRSAVKLWGREPKRGNTDEQFRGLFKFYLPDGTFVPYAQTPITQHRFNRPR